MAGELGTQGEMPKEVGDYGKVQRREESGCEEDKEYDALANNPIRGINGSF